MKPVIKAIKKRSLQTDKFSLSLKSAITRLLLKNINHRPVSGLSYISNIIQRTAYQQITDKTIETGCTEPLQSAYKNAIE